MHAAIARGEEHDEHDAAHVPTVARAATEGNSDVARWSQGGGEANVPAMVRRMALAALAVALGVLFAARTAAQELPHQGIDLHAHLFMKDGMGWLFRGTFEDPPLASSWEDRLASKASPATLEESGLGIVVVSIFVHPLGTLDMRDSVRRQVAAARRWVKEHPGWVLARSADEARLALVTRRRVMILSLEGAAGMLESEEDLVELVDELGIRIVTPLHLTDDALGGAAMLDGFQYFGNPVALADRLLDPGCDEPARNRRGLSPRGERLVRELVERGVWIDLAHAPDAALARLVPLLAEAGQPLLVTHGMLRRHRDAERGIPDELLAAVGRTGGMVGLVPSEDAFARLEVPPRLCPPGCGPAACARGAAAFAATWEEAAALAGADAVVVGSDVNGGMRHLAPSCGTRTRLDVEGFRHIGHSADLWAALRTLGAGVPPHDRAIERFLAAWSRVRPVALEGDAPPLPRRRSEVAGPSVRWRIGAGLSFGDDGEVPGALLQAELFVVKDARAPYGATPVVTFGHLTAEVTKAVEDDDVPYADVRLAPIGMDARWYDDHARGEALEVVLRRWPALDHHVSVRLAALSGAVRAMPGVMKSPGVHQLYVELGASVLGYRGIRHVDPVRADVHGVYMAGAALLLGMALYPGPELRVALFGGGDADVTLLAAAAEGVAHAADLGARAGVEIGTADGAFVQSFEARLGASRELAEVDVLWWTPRFTGGISIRP
jgi:membrane dipeptidase